MNFQLHEISLPFQIWLILNRVSVRALVQMMDLYLVVNPDVPEWVLVDTVLGGDWCVCGGGVVGQRATAWGGHVASQQSKQLTGHAAGKSCVDPGIRAWVQAGQQHQDCEGNAYKTEYTFYFISYSF